MARRESDREDLLREATALVERAELNVPGCEQRVAVGFRRDGSASFFFGGDPVYQFNTANELRRAYVGGLLYKADRSRLAALRRQRSKHEVVLQRVELPDDDAAAFLETLQTQLAHLRKAFAAGTVVVAGQVPAQADVAGRIRGWLEALPAAIRLARVPNVR